jgi:hypothetical protein
MWADERQARILMRENLPLAPTAFLKKVGNFYPSPKASKGDFAHQFDRVNAIISGPPLSLTNSRMDIQLQHPLYNRSLRQQNLQLPLLSPSEHPRCRPFLNLHGHAFRLAWCATKSGIPVCKDVAVLFGQFY